MEFTDAMYSSEKLRQYYGLSLWVSPDRAREYLAKLKGPPYYMTSSRIGELAGISQANLCQIILGRRGEGRRYEPVKSIHRDTEAAILGVQPEVDPKPGGGGYVDPAGTRRRLQALVAVGYPLSPLCEGIGWGADPQPVHRLIRGKTGTRYVMHSTYLRVRELYEKLAHVDPADIGCRPVSIGRAKRSAEKWGYAPPSAWDDDTIDDPDAIPEWTGACGTQGGYSIHVRDAIPVCPPCRAARTERNAELKAYDFDTEAFDAIMERRGISREDLGWRLGINPHTIDAWRWGIRRPPPERLDDLATVLDVSTQELTR